MANSQNNGQNQEKRTREENARESVFLAEKGEKPCKKSKNPLWPCLIAAGIALVSFGGGVLARQLSLDKEMRSLIRLKNRVQNSYYQEITDEEFYKTLFDAVSNELLDDYSKYMTADEYAQSRSDAKGEQSGVGLVFSTQTASGKDQLFVQRVCGNSPAEAAGIVAGDYVLGFGASESEITESVHFDEFVEFLANYAAGESFYVKFQSQGVVRLWKEAYVENYVFYRTSENAYCFTGKSANVLTEQGEPLTFLDDDTAYIRLTQFNGAAVEEFSQAMNLMKVQQKSNLVLDLRGNGGGYLDIMREISSYFCKTAQEDEPVVAVADYGEYREEFTAPDNTYWDYFNENSRVCVLADRDTASASECLIGCMIDYGTISYGDICLFERDGEAKTYGKGIMQTTYPLGGFGGDAVKLTTARICWPKELYCIHGRGILPQDGTLTVSKGGLGDEELKSAIEKLFTADSERD